MAAQPIDLVLQRIFCDVVILRAPLGPMFPVITATPPRHNQNSLLISEIQKLLGLQLTFQTNRIQTHILYITAYIMKASRLLAQQHVGRPAAAANKNLLSVY